MNNPTVMCHRIFCYFLFTFYTTVVFFSQPSPYLLSFPFILFHFKVKLSIVVVENSLDLACSI